MSSAHPPGTAASGVVGELAGIVGAANCLTDPDLMASYCTDWTRRYTGTAVAVVRPCSTAEVAAVVTACARAGVAVVAQGGNTGLVGGSVPRTHSERPQVVVSLRRLDTVSRCDAGAGVIEVGAGVTLADAASAAAAVGRRLGIDLGARDSATIGGMVATNAGGVNVVRFGSMRRRIAGIEAVLADGTIVTSLRGLAKDSIGWEPAGLLTGSEGTLAVITRVLLRLEPTRAHRVTALVALAGGTEAAVALMRGPLGSLPDLEAAELTLPAGMELVSRYRDLPAPIGLRTGGTAWLTIEATGDSDPADRLAGLLDDPSVLEVAVASDATARARLWAYREQHPEAIASLGIPHKLDVATTPDRLPELLAALPSRVASGAPDAQIIVFGHVAEGNMHVNVVGPPPEDDRVDDAVIRLVLEFGGSISAEHGIGIAKRRWLTDGRSTAELDLQRRVKVALDPLGILNPGVLEPL